MKSRKGFTLIELMVVILIVAILAAILVPIMRGRIDAAKWSEGKSGAGTISVALRAYCVEQGQDVTAAPTLADLNFQVADLAGKYFATGNYSITVGGGGTLYDESSGAFDYYITVSRPASISSGGPWYLMSDGTWTDTNPAGP